jgi:hypothetical protein
MFHLPCLPESSIIYEQGINYAALFTKEVKMHQDMPPIANCQKQMVQLQDCSGRILMVIL